MSKNIFAAIYLSIAAFSIPTAVGQEILSTEVEDTPQQIEMLSGWTDEVPDSTTFAPDSTIYAPDGRRWDEMLPAEAVGFALDTTIVMPPLPNYFFMPAVYDHFEFRDTVAMMDPMFSGRPELRWLEEQMVLQKSMERMKFNFFFRHPEKVLYNTAMLPQAPKQYRAVIDPTSHTVEIKEIVVEPVKGTTLTADEVKKRHWIRKFEASLLFTQAYVSPNWYQGGNNNTNISGNLFYNVKLNQQYHPNLIFDFTAQYKLGLNSAPNDTLRNYSISDDLLQLNTIFGVKAAKRWYYSFTGQFKTQMFNSYTSNTRNLRSAFLSPGEFTGGLGMTYDYSNKKKTFSFYASLAPLSYNLKICTNKELDETRYGIHPGHTTLSTYGSTAEFKLFWRLAYNITFDSRLFTFSNFERIQSDWENTLRFEINRFLSTQIYAHIRYDTNGVPAEGTKWKKLQVKEIFSLRFTYTFSSI